MLVERTNDNKMWLPFYLL